MEVTSAQYLGIFLVLIGLAALGTLIGILLVVFLWKRRQAGKAVR